MEDDLPGGAPGAVFTASYPEGQAGLQHLIPLSNEDLQSACAAATIGNDLGNWLMLVNSAARSIFSVINLNERQDERMMLDSSFHLLCSTVHATIRDPSSYHILQPGELLNYIIRSVADNPTNSNICTFASYVNKNYYCNVCINDLNIPSNYFCGPNNTSYVPVYTNANNMSTSLAHDDRMAPNSTDNISNNTCVIMTDVPVYTNANNMSTSLAHDDRMAPNYTDNVSNNTCVIMTDMQCEQSPAKNITSKRQKSAITAALSADPSANSSAGCSSATSGLPANKKLRAGKTEITTSKGTDFITVSQRKAAKRQDIIKNGAIVTTNRFQSLECETADTEVDTEIENDNTNIPKQNKVVRPEPLFLKMDNKWRDHIKAINTLIGGDVQKKVSGELLKIMPKDIDQYRVVQKFLSDSQCEFFGMRPRPERPRKVLIKGVPNDTPIEEVKNELTRLNYAVHRVSVLKHNKTKRFLPMYLCDIFLNDQFKNIFEIRNFLGFMVDVVPYVYRGVKQCYNCQRFNHSSDTCTLKPVCVKCAGGHPTKSCTAPQETLLCCNCQGNHTANYRGCPRNPRNIQADREKIKTFRSTTVVDGISYSNATTKKHETAAALSKNSSSPDTSAKEKPNSSAPPPPDDINFPPLPKTSNKKPRTSPPQTPTSLNGPVRPFKST